MSLSEDFNSLSESSEDREKGGKYVQKIHEFRQEKLRSKKKRLN